MKSQLYALGVSHLEIYDPKEERRIWSGVDRENGFKIRYVEGHYIVYQITEGGPAARGGVLPGDEIISFNNQSDFNPWGLEGSPGRFEFLRGSKKTTVDLVPEELKVDESPSIKDLGSGRGLLRISSFREEYFDREKWLEVARQFSRYSHLVVDIRGNWGGNFGAMLRAVSSFICEPTVIGVLAQPRKAADEPKFFMDDLAQDKHLKLVEESSEIVLQTFDGYPCFRGRVTVLTDRQTASVSEIFASAMSFREKTDLVGSPTAGDVVLAVWYELSQLGMGYSISVPEAVFMNAQEEVLEGQGVWPDKVIDYKLEDARKGIDTLIHTALKN